jgi:acetolactate synthase-1/2/3 large subunit
MPATTRRYRGADVLIQSLHAASVKRIFTLSGNHIMAVFDAALDSPIELVHTRHEASAVHMADAWSRITGDVGVALVTGGPGHANAISALYTAQMAEAPIVLLSGHAGNAQVEKGAFQEMRQVDMAAPVCKAAWKCAGANEIAADIAQAIRVAKSGRPGPVHLSLPIDALEGVTESAEIGAPSFEGESTPLDPVISLELMTRLVKAKRPLILVGPTSMTRRARLLTNTLQSATGVPVIGMESPRGISDPSLGAFAQMLRQTDCLLLIGKRLDFTLQFGSAAAFPVQAQVHQVDAQTSELSRSQRALGARLHITALADATSALVSLIRVARPGPPSSWLAEVGEAIAFRPSEWETASTQDAARLHPVQMLRPLQTLLDSHEESVLVCDGGEIGQWAVACLSAPHRVINGMAGSIGSGLPYALAARYASPNAPVVAIMGDGTVGFHISEFDTAVRYGLPFVAVIGNDARWNAEYQIQLREYGPDRLGGCELRPIRYDAVAQAFGAHGELVTQAAAMLPAALRASASGLPACVNVMIEGIPAPQIRR